MLLSKVVLARKKNARAVLASIRTHGAQVAQALDGLCCQVRRDAGPAADYRHVLEDLGRLLEQRTEALEAADWAHLDEEANDRRLRRVRDDATRRIHRKMVEISATLNGAYGPYVAEEILHLGTGLRRRPEEMLELARKATAKLDDPGLELPPSQLDGVELSLDAFRLQIEEHLAVLQPAILALTTEGRKFDETLKAKREAIADFDKVYVQCVRLLDAFYRLSGNELLADRIRPTVAQSSAADPQPEPDPAAEPTEPEEAGEAAEAESDGADEDPPPES